MKKHLSKITSLVLSLVIIFSGIFSIIVSADTPGTRPKMIKDHFERLNALNVDAAPNMDGTCTFVAMSMLLSYYDAYWNDSFIPDDMDWDTGTYDSSTDILYSTFNANTEASEWNNHSGSAEDFSIEHENEYLQSYLMGISRDKYLVLQVALVDVQVKAVLEDYLYNTCHFTEEQVKVKIQHQLTHGDDTLYNTMKEQIALGNPLIYLGLSVDVLPSLVDSDVMELSGHAMVAYDVFTNGADQEDIKLNRGWNNNNTYDSVKTTEFTHHNSIIWLEIDENLLPHECTDAYYDAATGDNVCSCYVYYNTHPKHQSHNYQYNNFNTTYHWEQCHCGEQNILYNHNLRYYQSSGTSHLERCIECSYQATVSHNYVNYINNVSTHGAVCACGYVNEEEHYRHSFEQYTNTLHKTYCICGHYIGTETHSMVTSGRYATCTDCGVVVDTFFIPVIKGIEENYDIE